MFCALVLKRRKPRTLGSNHLSINCIKTANPYLCSFPSVRRPYHNLGCTLAGFTSFHSSSFQTRLRHCGTFQEVSTLSEDLGFPSAVSISATSAYLFAKYDHYGHLRTVRAWTFLSNTNVFQRLLIHL